MILPGLISIAEDAIRCWYESWDGEVCVSYSGGIDSEVLLHIARNIYPDIPALFLNTGLEYPEIVKQVKSHKNVIIMRPKKSFKWVIENHGYPVGSKRIAKAIRALQNPKDNNAKSRHLYLTGDASDGHKTRFKIGRNWLPLIDSGIPISHKCCDILKKEPASRCKLKTMIALTKGEGSGRDSSLPSPGPGKCNLYDRKDPKSYPLKDWTKNEILEYILLKRIPYCSVYGDIIEIDGKLETSGEKRTGCMFCMFGIGFDKTPNRFQRMYLTHRKQWEFCMKNLRAEEICKIIKIKTKPRVGFGL